MPKFCPACGFKLDNNYNFCPDCGVKLSGKNKNKSGKPENQQAVNNTEQKNLDPKIIYGILIGGVAVIAAIILFSGVLDTDSVSNTNFTTNQQSGNVNSGVNLNNMQLLKDLEEKVKQNPDDLESLVELAHLKNDSGLFEAAIKDYKIYLAKKPEDADVRVDMGVCYFNLKDYPSAIKEMELALKYQPKHQIAHLNLGVVNLSAGNLEKSKEWLKKAYEINPENEIGKKAEALLKNH